MKINKTFFVCLGLVALVEIDSSQIFAQRRSSMDVRGDQDYPRPPTKKEREKAESERRAAQAAAEAAEAKRIAAIQAEHQQRLKNLSDTISSSEAETLKQIEIEMTKLREEWNSKLDTIKKEVIVEDIVTAIEDKIKNEIDDYIEAKRKEIEATKKESSLTPPTLASLPTAVRTAEPVAPIDSAAYEIAEKSFKSMATQEKNKRIIAALLTQSFDFQQHWIYKSKTLISEMLNDMRIVALMTGLDNYKTARLHDLDGEF